MDVSPSSTQDHGIATPSQRAPEVVQEIAWKAQKRMWARCRLLEARGKLKVQVKLELIGISPIRDRFLRHSILRSSEHYQS
jgi:hypothetical protein